MRRGEVLAAAVSVALAAGVALDLIRFPTDIASSGAAIAIPDEVLDKLALASGPLPAVLVAISPFFLLGYHLTRARHAEIIAGLEQRHGTLERGD